MTQQDTRIFQHPQASRIFVVYLLEESKLSLQPSISPIIVLVVIELLKEGGEKWEWTKGVGLSNNEEIA
jgi:hypothetical protein